MADEKTCDTFLTIQQTGEILSCTPQFIYSLIGSGELRAIKLGSRALRISVNSLHDYINSNWVDPEKYRDDDEEKKPSKANRRVKPGARSTFVSG